MYAAIAILAIAAISVALITAFEFEVVAALHSCDFSWETHMFHLHPNTSELAAVTAMSSALPFLALISVWLSANTHLMKSVVCLGWIVCLFLVEEMFLPNVELLPSGVFMAVITLAVFHLLTSLRIHIFAYYALFFAGKIIGFALRFLRSAFRPLIGISCAIMSPLIMHMLIEDVVNPFIHIACQYNIHSFGLFVVGTFFFSYLMRKIVSLARRFYGWIVAMSTFFITAAHHPVLWNLVTMIGFLAISAATVLAIVAALEILAIAVKRLLAWLLRRMLAQVLRPQRRAAGETHPAPSRPSVSWRDGLQSDHLPFQPHTDGQSVSRSWYLLIDSRRNKQRLRNHVAKMRLVLSEIGRIVSHVYYVEIDPTRYQAFMELNSRVDGNYQLESRAQSALAELTLLYNELKQRHPRRFRLWGKHQQLYEECVLFEQGIDIIFTELKLRAEFDANDAIRCCLNTMMEAEEDSAFENDHDEAAEEANVPAVMEAPDVPMPLHQEDALLPIDNDEFEANFDNNDGGVEEDVEEVPLVRRRRRCRREVSSLASNLGDYWIVPSTARRRSSRARREPQ